MFGLDTIGKLRADETKENAAATTTAAAAATNGLKETDIEEDGDFRQADDGEATGVHGLERQPLSPRGSAPR